MGAYEKDDKGNFYCIYPSYDAFMQDMLTLEPKKRHGYELIRENTPSHPFADIEWEDESKDENT